jgi:hypothetical protein
LKIYRNEDCSKLKTLEAAAISSFRKKNASGSKKTLNPQEVQEERENTVSIFQE